MKPRFFVSCWGNEVDVAGALSLAKQWQADGIEGPVPSDEASRQSLLARGGEVPWIAEVATGGGYVPRPRLTVEEHLHDLRRLIEGSLPFSPLLVNVLAGSDAWPFRDKLRFYQQALAMEAELGVPLSFETHRSRPTFHPWVVRDLLLELPNLRLTCDFSHWCVVCERLVLDDEPELLELCARHVRHVHARVGYDQGPQVPDPRAPAFALVVEAHLRWWRRLAQASPGLTFTPESGPDGYQQCEPFSQRPLADLREVNAWMMQRLRDVMTAA